MKKINRRINLKVKIINSLMQSGEKKTSEKILLKALKSLQKSTKKRYKDLVQLFIINSTSTFKLNEQVLKKGKRKVTKSTPSFILENPLRISTSLKTIKRILKRSSQSSSFYSLLSNEILSASQFEGKVVEQKNELQKQIIQNKRYLSKFRW